MLSNPLAKLFICFISCICFLNILVSDAIANRNMGNQGSSFAVRFFLRELKLSEGCSDDDIIRFLDVSNKRITACSLIRYKKISSAKPKLIEIVNSKETNIPEKLSAAIALCDFGNKDWIPQIKVLLKDKKHEAFVPLKLEVAGLLARAGDYSQFEFVANQIGSSKKAVRLPAFKALGNFGHKTEKVTDLAADLLKFAAVSDSVPFLREYAIEKLEKIAAKKPAVSSIVIEALEANRNSSDKKLRVICEAKLKRYGR